MKRTNRKEQLSSHGRPETTSALIKDPSLGYKLRVLLYDLRHVAKDHASQTRLSQTLDPLYISSPYFTSEEAAIVKNAIVDHQPIDGSADAPEANILGNERSHENIISTQARSVEIEIQDRLSGFLDKRRASGDARPCGPHDLAPLYESTFGIQKEELEDEGLLRRLRKCGLEIASEMKVPSEVHKKGQGKKGRK